METEFSENYETRFNIAREKIALAKSLGKKSVNISGLGLKTIPEELFEMLDLKELHLGGNQITDLPENVANFQKLTLLSIQRCQLSKIPNCVLNLKSLQSLNLSRNKIEAIPDSINSLTDLRTLTLAKNKIKHIPPTIGSLNKLSILELRGNLISKIPKEMSNLRGLTRITLLGNPINFPHSKQLKGILPSQNALFQILHHFVNEGTYDEKKSKKEVTSQIELPETLRTAFQQYLVFFNDFIEKAKGIKIDLQVSKYDNGLEITYPITIDSRKIQSYLNEYIGFIRQKIDKVNPIFEKSIVQANRDLFIVELKNQLRHLTGQFEIKKVENNLLQKQVDMLYEVLVVEKKNPQPIQINSSSQAISNSTATSNVTIDFKLEIKELQNDFLNFKNEIVPYLKDGQLSELELIDKNLLEVDETEKSPQNVDKVPFKRLKRIIEQINDPESDWSKTISATKKGIGYFQKLGKQYNKIAPWLAIPSIPEQLL